MSLFTALWPPEEAVGHLAAAVDRLRSEQPDRVEEATAGLRKFRFIPPERWHLTLCFHGDAGDQQHLSERMDRRIRRLRDPAAPHLRLAAAGVFRGVLWIGFEPHQDADAVALRALVRAAGADPRSYEGHLTVARWGAGRPDQSALRHLLHEYRGPWWTAREITLVRSEQVAGAPLYRTVHRVGLTSVSGEPGDTGHP
jgi:RNA 2',3'-cyclic 3'-phosphodiesterase